MRAFHFPLFSIFITFVSSAFAADIQHLQKFYETRTCAGCDLREANFSNFVVDGANQAAYLTHSNLEGAKLEKFDARRAIFYQTSFKNASLEGARFVDCVIRYCSFEGTKLGSNDFTESFLISINFRNKNLRSAKFVAVRTLGLRFDEADLTGADFQDADLRYAVFKGADLKDANFAGAKLGNAVWTDGRVCAAGSVGSCQ